MCVYIWMYVSAWKRRNFRKKEASWKIIRAYLTICIHQGFLFLNFLNGTVHSLWCRTLSSHHLFWVQFLACNILFEGHACNCTFALANKNIKWVCMYMCMVTLQIAYIYGHNDELGKDWWKIFVPWILDSHMKQVFVVIRFHIDG